MIIYFKSKYPWMLFVYTSFDMKSIKDNRIKNSILKQKNKLLEYIFRT